MPRHRARRWRRHWDRVAPSFALPEAVRRIVYTTDATRALSSKPRRAVRARGHFPSDEAATKLPCLVLSRAAEDRKRPPREWLKAKTQPAIVAGRALQGLLNVISLAHRSPDSPTEQDVGGTGLAYDHALVGSGDRRDAERAHPIHRLALDAPETSRRRRPPPVPRSSAGPQTHLDAFTE